MSSGSGRRRARRRVNSKADKEATARSFRHNMLLDTHGDVYDFYEHLETIGEGSISTISKVRKRFVGGSARYGAASDGATGGRAKRGDRRAYGSLFGRISGASRTSKAESVVNSQHTSGAGDHALGDSLRFGTQAVDANSPRPGANTSTNNEIVTVQQQYKDETESSGGVGGDDEDEDNHIRHHNEMIFALKSIDLRVVNDDHLQRTSQ